MLNWLSQQWNDIKGNAKWDLIKYAVVLSGASAMALIAVLWQSLRHVAIDRYLFGILFLLSAGMFAALVRKIPSPHSVKRTPTPTVIESESPKLVEAKADTILDGELQRVFIYPRMGIPYKMLKEIWQVTKHSEEPKVDCDILAAMYVVNISPSIRYIRDITISVEVEGERKDLERQDDFRLRFRDDESDDLEYGFELEERHGDPIPLKPLLPPLPCELPPNKPLEGWIRFIARNVAPERIDSNTWQFAIIDSLGNRHFITKASEKPKKGEIGFRRVR